MTHYLYDPIVRAVLTSLCTEPHPRELVFQSYGCGAVD